eukprot:TRINITY_DN6561_c2_g1_i5.p2 TRINITY_DN6561_c2_g1~~TRINITY_DN6561_c2_g1_i5.p2  ORF type:complete len:158 (-),score=4.75 TRINITY_DN6561_c2_g1_i5:23-496(-)
MSAKRQLFQDNASKKIYHFMCILQQLLYLQERLFYEKTFQKNNRLVSKHFNEIKLIFFDLFQQIYQVCFVGDRMSVGVKFDNSIRSFNFLITQVRIHRVKQACVFELVLPKKYEGSKYCLFYFNSVALWGRNNNLFEDLFIGLQFGLDCYYYVMLYV